MKVLQRIGLNNTAICMRQGFRVTNSSLFFFMCLLLALSSCSTSSFLQRRYTAGEYVEHKANLSGAEVSSTRRVCAAAPEPVLKQADGNQSLQKKSGSKKEALAAEHTLVFPPEQFIADQGLIIHRSFLGDTAESKLKPNGVAAAKSYGKVKRATAKSSADLERSEELAYNYGLASLIFLIAGLLGVLLMLGTFGSDVAIAFIFGFVLVFPCGLGYVYCTIASLAWSIGSIVKAVHSNMPVGRRVVKALIMIFLPLLLALIALIVTETKL
jgi:hypothetical protein